MSETLFADLVLDYLGRDAVTLKGDLPGHEFRGNQYAEGGGSGGGESGGGDGGGSGGSVDDAIAKIVAHNQRQNELSQYNATHVKPNDKVSAWVHTSAMARQAGKPKIRVTGRITSTDTNDQNEQIARIEFEHRGKIGSAWINTARDKWSKE